MKYMDIYTYAYMCIEILIHWHSFQIIVHGVALNLKSCFITLSFRSGVHVCVINGVISKFLHTLQRKSCHVNWPCSTLQGPVAIIGQHGCIQEEYHPLSHRVKAMWSLTTACSGKTTFESHAAPGQMWIWSFFLSFPSPVCCQRERRQRFEQGIYKGKYNLWFDAQ